MQQRRDVYIDNTQRHISDSLWHLYNMTPVEKRDEIVIYDTEVFHLIILKSAINLIDDIIIIRRSNKYCTFLL